MTYRILTLDGGGSWALLQAMALGRIYDPDMPGPEILRKFDLVAANSGGSLTLAGLISGQTPGNLLNNFFLQQSVRSAIFKPLDAFEHIFDALGQAIIGIGPKYDASAKIPAFEQILPVTKTLLSAIPALLATPTQKGPDLLLASFDYDFERGIIFRSNNNSLARSFSHSPAVTLSQAMSGSTNAPVNFFDLPVNIADPLRTYRTWDGGVAGHNNPALIAVAEAIANGVPPAEICVLSIGTGTVVLPVAADGSRPPIYPTAKGTGLIDGIQTLSTSILDDPPDIASYLAHIVLGGKLPATNNSELIPGPVIRVSPMVCPQWNGSAWVAPAGLPEPLFSALANLPMDAVQDADVANIHALGVAWLSDAVPNQPIRMNHDTLACEIGHPVFGLAADAWGTLSA